MPSPPKTKRPARSTPIRPPRAEPVRTPAEALSRLPRAVRDRISQALEDGADWREIAEIAAAAGCPGVRAQNVSNYRKRSHKDWLARQERLEAIRRDSETSAAIFDSWVESGGSPAEAGLVSAAEMLQRGLGAMGPEAIAELVRAEPKAFFAALRELRQIAALIAARRTDAREAAAASPPAAPAPIEDSDAALARLVSAVDKALGVRPAS